jgi:hypothetical protein
MIDSRKTKDKKQETKGGRRGVYRVHVTYLSARYRRGLSHAAGAYVHTWAIIVGRF